MTKHDTAAIRRLAGRLDRAAQELSRAERGAAAQITGISDDMTGDTPRAIDQVTGKLSDELKSIYSGLTRSADALNRYARELDIADAKAQQSIGTK